MVKVTQNSWLGGQLDVEMIGRQDYQKYAKGASVIKNFNFLKRGGLTKRQGFDRLVKLNDSQGLDIQQGETVRIVPFSYKKDHGFVLLFAPGKCYAVFTKKTVQYNVWAVSIDSAIGAFSSTEINEFDYCQCGYKLFIAHPNHPPSVIETTEYDVNSALTNPSHVAFTWKKFPFNALTGGIPSITRSTLTRIAPTGDTAGGTFVEKYKASAVYDDVETKCCTEFYNESIGGISTITSESGGTVTQMSTSKTAGYTSVGYTYQNGQYTISSKTEVPATTNTSTSRINKVQQTYYGTKYYLPWVESQSINLNISIPHRNGKIPDKINVYKKGKGYFGLAGTIELHSQSGGVATTVYATGLTRVNSVDASQMTDGTDDFIYRGSTSYSRTYENTSYSFETESVYAGGSSWYVTLIPSVPLKRTSYVVLYLDGCECEYPEKNSSNYNAYSTKKCGRPKTMTARYHGNLCSKVNVTIQYRYSNSSGQVVTDTTTLYNVSIEASQGHYTTYPSSGTYANNSGISSVIARDYSTFCSGNINKKDEIDLSAATYDVQDCEITAIVIEPYNSTQGTFYFRGATCRGTYTPASVSFTDNNIIPDSSITPISDDFEQPMTEAGDYPRTVALFQQRLIWASSNRNANGVNHRMTVWMSAVGDFSNYTEHEIQKDDDTIEFDMPVTRFAEINHIVEMKQLLAFNQGCEWIIGSSSATKGITYETIIAKPQSYCGSNPRLKPLVCNNAIIFSDRTGQAVRRFAYNIQDDGFAGKDISILSSGIFEQNSIVDWTYQQYPIPTVWCVLSDGTLASLALMEEQDIIAWAVHKHGNPNAKFRTIATSMAVSPSLADIGGGEENAYGLARECEVFAIVEDTNTNDRWLERMRVKSRTPTDTVYNSLCLDSAFIVSSGTTHTLASGQIAVNGTTGEITSSGSVQANAIVGYPFESRMTSMYPVVGNVVGNGQFDIKGIENVGVRLINSTGGTVVAENSVTATAEPIRYLDDKDSSKAMTIGNSAVTLKNCDCTNIKLTGVNNRDGRITIASSEPWPFTLIETEVDYDTESGGRQ